MPYLNGQVISDEDLQGKLNNYRNSYSGPGHAPEDDQSIINFWEGKSGETWKQNPSDQGANQNGSAQQWNTPPAEGILQGQASAAAGQNGQRNSDLWNTLWGRATQSTQVDRNDPAVRQQADAYAANETRSSRNYLADLAEKANPNANLRGETRLAAERVGQRTGTMEAGLIGQELQAKRQEIADALSGLKGMLSQDQQLEAQKQLSVLDSQLKQMGYNQNWNLALMQNDQFTKQLGLNAEDRASYWDAVRRGIV